ncbi:hypothetical protein U1Q18_032707 [Sarracenia purpurea var. burkii]
MANKFSVLGSINSVKYDKCFPLLVGTKSKNRSNSWVLRAVKYRYPKSILDEAESIRKSLLGVCDLPKYEMIVVRSVAKSIENEVNILRKSKPFDSKRLKALEKRINYLKRSKSPIRINPLWGDENGEERVEATNPKGKDKGTTEAKQGPVVPFAVFGEKMVIDKDEEDEGSGTEHVSDEAKLS